MNRCILHVDLDAFFVAVEQALRPELRGKPVVVGGRPDRRGVVASASYEARNYGVRSAMPLATAYRLCPKAIFLEGSFLRYRQASAGFHGILADYSPAFEPVGIDEAYLDVTGCEALHGPAAEMSLRIKERIKEELGLTASVGIATSKVVAKIASDMNKPDGLVEIRPGEEHSFLAPLPLSRLPGLGKKSEVALKNMGVTTVGSLASLSLVVVRARLGSFGVALQRYANGIDERKVAMPGATRSISRETTFAEDTMDRVFLRSTLHYLCERVGAELRQQQRQARCVTLKLRYYDFETISRSSTLTEPTDVDQLIFQRALALFEKALSQRKEVIRLIGVEASRLAGHGRQLHMLDGNDEKLARLNETVDRIRRKYGFTSIQTGRTFTLREVFAEDKRDFHLHTPSLFEPMRPPISRPAKCPGDADSA